MATITQHDEVKSGSHWADEYLSSWKDVFDEETRHRLACEESFAWKSVTGVLITILSIGLLFGILAVTLASL